MTDADALAIVVAAFGFGLLVVAAESGSAAGRGIWRGLVAFVAVLLLLTLGAHHP